VDTEAAWRLSPGSRVRRRTDGRVLTVVRVLPWSGGPLVWCAEDPASHPEPWTPEEIEAVEDQVSPV